MILEKGDMWSRWGKSDLWLFTACSHLTWQGELTMGAGIAREVKEKFPRMPEIMGAYLRHDGYGDTSSWGVCVSVYIPGITGRSKIGAFQTKWHWKESSSLALIGHSVLELQNLCRYGKLSRVDLNFPGIGCGGLERAHVLPIVRELPDVVHVWERATKK